MKTKLIFPWCFLFVLSVGITVFLSCNKNTGIKNRTTAKETNNSPVKVIPLNSSSVKLLKPKIIKWQYNKIGSLINVNHIINGHLNTNSVGANSDSTGFNYDSLSMVVINSDTAIMAKQIGATGSYGYYAAFYLASDTVNSSLIIKVDSLSQNTIKVNYYNPNQVLLFTSQTNIQTGVSSVAYVYANSADNSASGLRTNSLTTYTASGGCGQGTANCLADVYTNHGWVSVWAFVQTAFIPATAAALAAACAAKNCL